MIMVISFQFEDFSHFKIKMYDEEEEDFKIEIKCYRFVCLNRYLMIEF